MIPDRDEIARRQTPNPPPPPPTRSGRLWPLYALILILVSAVGYLGYQSWWLQQQIIATQDDAQSRLAVLEGQLSATDESLTLNASAIQANFSNIGAEIRRLWDVADTRNRDWIRENQAALAEIQPQVERFQNLAEQSSAQAEQILSLQNSVNTALAQSQASQSALNELRAQFGDDFLASSEEINARLDILEVRLASGIDQITSTQQTLNQMNESLAEATLNRDALSNSISALNSRINQLDDITSLTEFEQMNERIEAFDISRSDTIQRLSSMQSQIRALREQVEALQ
jgi:chromosome segregation ATPase